MERKVLSLLVANQFGVLTRVSNLFGQRGFNIDSLAVGETENPRFSRITITTHGNEAIIIRSSFSLPSWKMSRMCWRSRRTSCHT